MRSPDARYPAVLGWVDALAIGPVGAGEASVANVVTALLSGQRVRSAAWTIRLRAKLNVGMDGEGHALRDLIQASRSGQWTCRPSTYGTGRQRVAGHLGIGRGDALPVLPRH